MGDENPIRSLRDYSKPSHEGYKNTIELLIGNNVDFLKLVDSLDLDGENRERTRMRLFQFSLRYQAGNWLERIPAGSISIWENLTTRLLAQFFPPRRTAKLRNDILIGPHDTQTCMENPEQAFVEYASSRTNEAGVPRSPNTQFICSKEDDGEVMFIEIVRDNEPRCDDPHEVEGATTEEPVVEYFNTFPTKDELTYHRYLMSGPIPLIFLRNPIITEGCPHNLKIPCNIGHVHIKKAYIDLDSPLNIMTRMMYNWIIRRKLNPREDANGGISNFTRRIKGMHVFVGNFTYVIDFMIIEDISSILDPRLSQVVLGKPFIEISNMTHDPHEGAVRFIRGTDEVAYKMPHKIEQYDSLSDLEKSIPNQSILGTKKTREEE
ncbi:retrotransposon ORF1 [Tanacetum coccineum]